MSKKASRSIAPVFPAFEPAPGLCDVSYSGDKPNPNLRDFVQEHSRPYDPETDEYDASAFNQPITSTKATPIYNMHSYHQGKKPHDAIRQYIRHYTKAGDVVMDPFSGSGGTSLAALMEGRHAIAIDRSPAATFITKNYCTAVDMVGLNQSFAAIRNRVKPEMDWLYETRCDRCGGKATTAFTVYSYVFQCPRCLKKVPLFDCVEAEGRTAAGKSRKISACPHCHAKGHTEEISTRAARLPPIPVLVGYMCEGACRPARGQRQHNDPEAKKRAYFEKHDLARLEEIESRTIPYWIPPHKMMNVEDDSQPWGVKWRAGTSSFRTVADLFTKRNLWALAAWMASAQQAGDDRIRFTVGSLLLGLSRMCQYDPRWSFPYPLQRGTYYVPQISKEMNALTAVTSKLERTMSRAWRAIADAVADQERRPSAIVSTQSSTCLSEVPSNSVDYVFTDPPYSDNVQYGELNFVWEAWLGFDTRWHDEEIIVNGHRGKTEADWAIMMRQAMAECYRVLKPGRWLSLCYHDTSEGTWALVQDIVAEVGFIVDKSDTTLFIDTGTKSYNQLTADKATKRDLVLNLRKPKPGEWRITQVFIPADADIPTFQELGRQVIREFLTAHPGAPKDRIYDELVSRMVRKGQMEAHDFDALLRSVAEEVKQPVKKDLFDNRDPDLFGSHVTSRWYLKATADQIDHAEQEKEDAAAERLEKFMDGYLKKHREEEGVHYSDLFEQYLPIKDKPRRLLADWLPEYFFKTSDGTWRPPADEQERQQKAALREAGTLRRMKRFANALIDGVPIRDQDRPANDRTLAEWIRQCRRAGLYEQGRALYEKGGLNLKNLGDEEQIAVEDDYRICVKRKGEDGAKPKRQRRKKGADE
jgi:DNA modification methylase